MTLPDTDTEISYRGFTVGEQKALLQAIELKDQQALVNTIVDVVDACTYNKLDLKNLPMHVIDYIFLQIYIKAVGANATAQFNCAGLMPDGITACGNQMPMQINLEQAKVQYPEGYEAKKTIEAADGILINLRTPSFEHYTKIQKTSRWLDMTEAFIFAGIESVVDGNDVSIPGIDYTQEELTEWLDTLDGIVLDRMNQFFKRLPYLALRLEVTCPKCGGKEVFELTNLEAFFV